MLNYFHCIVERHITSNVKKHKTTSVIILAVLFMIILRWRLSNKCPDEKNEVYVSIIYIIFFEQNFVTTYWCEIFAVIQVTFSMILVVFVICLYYRKELWYEYLVKKEEDSYELKNIWNALKPPRKVMMYRKCPHLSKLPHEIIIYEILAYLPIEFTQNYRNNWMSFVGKFNGLIKPIWCSLKLNLFDINHMDYFFRNVHFLELYKCCFITHCPNLPKLKTLIAKRMDVTKILLKTKVLKELNLYWCMLSTKKEFNEDLFKKVEIFISWGCDRDTAYFLITFMKNLKVYKID